MASYRDWMLIDNPNELDEKQLRQAIRSMGSVANKRLKRMENRGINFGEDVGEDTTSGVRRFGVKGKNLQALKNEFKRVRRFLDDPQGSLTGMWNTLKEVKRRWGKQPTKKMRKDFSKMEKQKKKLGKNMETNLTRYEELRRWRDTWKYYNKLIDEGVWAPTEYDSNQVREMIYYKVSEQQEYSLSDDETYERIITMLKGQYEELQQRNEDDTDISTSSFFSMGESD